MGKVIKANGKCPLCGAEAYIGFAEAECTNFSCELFKEGVLSNEEHDVMCSNNEKCERKSSGEYFDWPCVYGCDDDCDCDCEEEHEEGD